MSGARPGELGGDLAGARALVVGLGASGTAAARALVAAGAHVRAWVPAPGTAAEVAGRLGLDLRVGPADPAALATAAGNLLAGCDVVVASPGVPPAHPLLAAAVAGGTPVWSEPELAWRLSGGRTRLVGITGTNGKTTTTELVAACLGAPTAGNIGTPLVEALTADPAPPLVVAELSSFQLHFTAALRTEVGVLLNLAPDHLDWHGSLEAYGADKARIWAGQDAGGRAVAGADDAGAMAVLAAHPPARPAVTFTTGAPAPEQVGVRDGRVVSRLGGADADVVAVADLHVAGPHNVANVAAAVAAALCAGAEPSALAGPLAAYRPGAHRLELVAEVDGVRWVNDSKATNPHAAAAALASYRDVVWIAGGLNKGLDFAPLAPLLAGRVRAALTIGASADDVAAVAERAGVPTVERVGVLDAAVARAAALARPGDVVLLAPACASMDQFRDYADRGRAFRDAVAALAAERSAADVPTTPGTTRRTTSGDGPARVPAAAEEG